MVYSKLRNDIVFFVGMRWQCRNWEVGAAKAGVSPDAKYTQKVSYFLHFYGPKMDPRYKVDSKSIKNTAPK
jgi:hypothetical protein